MASVQPMSPPPPPSQQPGSYPTSPTPPPPPMPSYPYSSHVYTNQHYPGTVMSGGGPPPPTTTTYDYDESDPGARCCGFFMLGFAIVGTIFAVLCFRSCSFLTYTVARNLIPTPAPTSLAPTPNNGGRGGSSSPTIMPSLAPSTQLLSNESPLVTVTFGLFVYLDIYAEQCVYYTYNTISDLSIYLNVARLGITISMLCSLIAGIVLLIEYAFCRVPCSRVFINLGYALAICGIPLTFVVFLQDQCRQSNTVGCKMGRGGLYALIALIAFFVTLILTCVLPKSVPLVKVLQRLVDTTDIRCLGCHRVARCHWQWTGSGGLSSWWWCCCWGSNKKKGADEDDDDDDLDMEGIPLVVGDLSTAEVVVDRNGHTYKQYHDETAGYTLQNQYTAAYKRWLVFEEDYDVALTKFKEACLEADVNWRVFLRKSKEKRRALKRQIQRAQEQQQQRQQQQQGEGQQEQGDDDEEDGPIPSNITASMTVAAVAANPGSSFRQLEEAAAAAVSSSAASVGGSLIMRNGDDTRTIATTEGAAAFQDEHEEDDVYLDDELVRHVDVLVTLQANCDFAKEVMNRIQNDINDHAKQEDVRHMQMLEIQQMQKKKLEEKKEKKKQEEEAAKRAKLASTSRTNLWKMPRRTQRQDSQEDATPFLRSNSRRTVASNRPNTPSSSHPPPQIELRDGSRITSPEGEGFEMEDGDMFASARMLESSINRTMYRIDRDGDLFASARMEPRAPILPSSATSRLHGTMPLSTETTQTPSRNDDDHDPSPQHETDGHGTDVHHRLTAPVANFFKAVPKRANRAWDKVVRRTGHGNDDDNEELNQSNSN